MRRRLSILIIVLFLFVLLVFFPTTATGVNTSVHDLRGGYKASGDTYDFNGTGNHYTGLFSLRAGLKTVSFTHNGDSNIIVWLRDQSGEEIDLWVNEIGTCSGSSLHSISTKKNYFLDIEADGDWTIHVGTPSSANARDLPQTFEGVNSGYSSFFKAKAGMLKFYLIYSGDSNFIVTLYKDTGEWVDLIENEIGSRTDMKLINVERGNYIIDIYAEGTWTIGVQQQTSKPFITSISPKSGRCGEKVALTGEDFGGVRGSSYVSFNEDRRATKYSSWSDQQIICTVPYGTTTGQVSVIKDVGTSNSVKFTVLSPMAQSTWYLAEGSTTWGYNCYITIQNPNASAVTADVTYMTGSGAMTAPDVNLPSKSQATINPADKVGNQDFSTKVVCKEGKVIAVDRTMSWRGQGASSPEAHSSIGVTSPGTTWYLPEGSSKWGFETWLLIQNPNGENADCIITYMIEGEGPTVVLKSVPANSRKTFNIADDIGEKDASIKVESYPPVIPERAMYRNSKREGHDSIGTTSPASDFYLAEGTSAYGFTTYVLIQNPNDEATDVTVTYMTPTGPKPQEPFSMDPNSRKTIRVNDVSGMGSTDFSTQVHGTKPIIAERAMYWDNGTGEACHDSVGMASSHTSFYLPDGQTSDGRETFTLVQNPNSTPVTVEISYLTPTGAGNVVFQDTIGANSRKTYNMADKGIVGRAAVTVMSKVPGMKVMCERAMYWNARGAGTDTIGGFSD